MIREFAHPLHPPPDPPLLTNKKCIVEVQWTAPALSSTHDIKIVIFSVCRSLVVYKKNSVKAASECTWKHELLLRRSLRSWRYCVAVEWNFACVQMSCCTRKRDVCVTPSLIVFQHPAGFPRSWEHAVIGWHTVRIVWLNADWLLSNVVW